MSKKRNRGKASHLSTSASGGRGGMLRSLRMPLAFAAIGCVGIAGSYLLMTGLYMPDAAASEEHLAQVAKDKEVQWESSLAPMPRKDHLASQDKSWKPPETAADDSPETPAGE